MQPNTIRTSEARDNWKPLRKVESVPADKYRIGTVGKAWGPSEKLQWYNQTSKKRSYLSEVVEKVRTADSSVFNVVQYGALSSSPDDFPLLAAVSRQWVEGRPSVLVTGGVHGYETSGVQGAILFLLTRASDYVSSFNVVVIPCVSPWGYERVERWNEKCLDPNRSFGPDPKTHTEESAAVKAFLASLGKNVQWLSHVDCHETTDTDETEYMPARAALAGALYKRCDIPDGFYLVGDNVRPTAAFHKAIIDRVRTVTHLAPGDRNGTIIEEVRMDRFVSWWR